jgi:hypothetical protein
MSALFFALMHAGSPRSAVHPNCVYTRWFEEATLILLAAEIKINLWRQQLGLCIYISITTLCIGLYSSHVVCDCFDSISFSGRLH